ncbi:TorF family putative porin [Methylophilus medardicus]|uniref:Omptin family outer membrane protease n=1 Tax=Methylophilus medardicus TaxID=2588534 RepID=A0A5B8CPS4_9PROT|nr:TorF family putative porin [Methylophilus medardicus]QDC43150.1 hypothetical protein FIU01_00505 [Methylophilus medardicus]QDC48157.1 hypothetical protein FIU00_00505 [Methylophilus medardicus]QDC51862.1 hypothetical protein FIT99_00505 [Methylophilus medardicus]
MRQSILLTAVLSTLSFAQVSYAAEEAKEEASDWTATANIAVVSDYYFRGISQSWHKPTAQGGMDITHSSGFYAGVWGSGVSPNTYPDANTEIDVYAGYNGTIPVVEKLGYTVGVYGYMYPGGSWKKYRASNAANPNDVLTPRGGRWDTYELNAGISYDWISAKVSYTLTDWFGADKTTGWDGSTKGSTYFELNAAYPLPWWDLTLIGHVGRLNVAGKLDKSFTPDGVNFPSTSISGATDPDYTDWKIGLSKAFKIGKTEGWNAGVYWVESDNSRYWGESGYGGTSFNGKGTSTTAQSKNLNEGRLILTVGRTF